MECLFCKIVKEKKKLAAREEIHLVGENEEVIAILDKFPVSDGHTLLITKKHFPNVAEVDEKSWKYLLPLMKETIQKIKDSFQPAGLNVISNMEAIAAQSIFHLHVHIIPKYEENEGFIWTAKPKLKYNLNQVAEKLK